MSSNQLKWIAMFAMVCDHFAYAIIWDMYMEACFVDGVYLMGDFVPKEAKDLYMIYMILRSIGRLTFPICAYFLVQGFQYTKDINLYMKRMFCFAILSEIPYNLLVSGQIFHIWSQNVLWTFLLALCLLKNIKECEIKNQLTKQTDITKIILIAGSIAVLGGVDYGIGGILLMTGMYLFRENREKFICSVVGSFVVMVFLGGMDIQFFGLLAFVLIGFTNEERKKGNKYIFYMFYPLHMLALCGLKYFLEMR